MKCEKCGHEMYEDSFEVGYSMTISDKMNYCNVWVCPKCDNTISREVK